MTYLGERPGIDVFVRRAFWDAPACARVRAAMDCGPATPAEVYVQDYVVDERVRRTFDVEVDPATVAEVTRALDAIRADVARFFGTTLTATEGPGFLRYPAGGFYRAHRDRLDEYGQEDLPRRISAVLFLTSTASDAVGDSCEGGTLRLHGEDPGREGRAVDIAPAAGMLVAFRSGILHEVLPVTRGLRDAVVDWFY